MDEDDRIIETLGNVAHKGTAISLLDDRVLDLIEEWVGTREVFFHRTTPEFADIDHEYEIMVMENEYIDIGTVSGFEISYDIN